MVDDEPSGTRAAAGDATADGTQAAYGTTNPVKAGHEPDTGELTLTPTWGSSSEVALPDPGYQLGELIGRGGMGEVVVAQDQRIGREVAVKRIRARAPTGDAITRFLREARIQARLDHPSIVPVYELGTDELGRPYFTMKRLAGVTLAKRLADKAPTQPLLRAFVDVCLAIQLAHSRGVVHRDLKPSNIMLGEYGEVYVIDWGVSLVMTDRQRTTQPGMSVATEDGTTAGAILGTPGFMAPEQVRGQEAGPPADVYALGSILFEILAGEPLHPRGEAALASTLTRPQEAPAARAPARTIAPELDAVCVEALVEDPTKRPTVRELGDRVQAYLDGDRDLERRRVMAGAQLVAARAALSSTEPDARATAMRRAGRALALDPESVEAAQLVTSLILEPPTELPPALIESLDQADVTQTKERGRKGAWAYASVLGLVLGFVFLDIRDWGLLTGFLALHVLAVLLAIRIGQTGRTSLPVSLTLSGLSLMMFSRVASPFILTPIVVCAMMASFSLIPELVTRRRVLVTWVVVTVMLPFLLEWTGVLRHTWDVVNGAIVTISDVYYLHGRTEAIALVVANLGFMVVTALFLSSLARSRRDAQRALHIQAWHLRQLLPEDRRPWQTGPVARQRGAKERATRIR